MDLISAASLFHHKSFIRIFGISQIFSFSVMMPRIIWLFILITQTMRESCCSSVTRAIHQCDTGLCIDYFATFHTNINNIFRDICIFYFFLILIRVKFYHMVIDICRQNIHFSKRILQNTHLSSQENSIV